MKKFGLICITIALGCLLVACNNEQMDIDNNVVDNNVIDNNVIDNNVVDNNVADNNVADEQQKENDVIEGSDYSGDTVDINVINLKEYEGTWIEKDAGNTTGKNTHVDIKANSDNTIDFEYSCEQISEMRVAIIAPKNVEIDNNGIGTFEFDDDGHGNSGEGTISLKMGVVTIDIAKLNMNDNAMWMIADGVFENKN